MGINKVVYVSCNPATLARDMEIMRNLGYKLGAVQPVDMFPGTYHVECVVLMTREQTEVINYECFMRQLLQSDSDTVTANRRVRSFAFTNYTVARESRCTTHAGYA